jgi:hypothetical protein
MVITSSVSAWFLRGKTFRLSVFIVTGRTVEAGLLALTSPESRISSWSALT